MQDMVPTALKQVSRAKKKHLDKVKVKVPYDYNQGKKNVVSGYTLQALLSDIALSKGENIVHP